MLGNNLTLLREAHEVIEGLSRQSAAEGVLDVMQRALARIGCESFCLITFPDPKQKFEDVVLAIRVPEEFRKLYAEEQYIRIDPTISHFKRTDSPFKWQDAPFDPEREPRVIEFMQRRADFGLLNGLWFPIPGPQDCVGGAWMGGRAAELNGSEASIVHFMVLSAFDRLLRLRAPTSGGTMPLTIREREVLVWAAQGKSSWEIGEILGISERTVNEHVQHACSKLDAVNRTQAIVTALCERLIAL
jgi:DNA-binding CsgD family transcriptional regulator